ncbi:MAG: hypothetical protein JNM27_02910 [Leptospirales bacterium]|nr:hypothetical protein [Leptospirales bacterium]
MIYEELAENGSAVDLIEYSPALLLANLKGKFPGVEMINESQINWDSEAGSFLAQFSSLFVIFSCYRLSTDRMNDIIDCAFPLGLKLYDPQSGERYPG